LREESDEDNYFGVDSGSNVSSSADLGYCYGSYELREGGGAKTEKGYYARVWKRDARGNWRIVFDLSNPLPDDQK